VVSTLEQTWLEDQEVPIVTEAQNTETRNAPAENTPEILERLKVIYNALDDKKATDISILNLTGVSTSLDYFVIASANSQPQLQALERSVLNEMRDVGVRPAAVEGPSPRWVLVNFGDIIVHLMTPETRDFYDLEGLWADASPVEL
jgi:ribosome-associated protein